MTKTRIGIVGIGNIGNFHANNLLADKIPNAELTAVCDLNPAAMERFPGVRHFKTSKKLIRSGKIDALIVATPHYAHTPIAIDALQTGLHVLVEKPLTVQKADCEKMIAAHTNPKQVFAIVYQARTEPRYIALRELVRSGKLGRIRRINWIITTWFRTDAYYASSDWRATWAGEGGGILVNQLPHDLDLFQWIFGMPARVRALCPIGKYHNIEVEDEINALMEYEDGATGFLCSSTGEAPGTDRREVAGEWGRVIVHGDRLEFTRNKMEMTEFSRTTTESFGRPESTEEIIPVTGVAGGHVQIVQNFVDSIQTGVPLIAPAEEGIFGAQLANAIILSSETDKTVSLPLDSAAFQRFLKKKIRNSKTKAESAAPAGPAQDMASSFKH